MSEEQGQTSPSTPASDSAAQQAADEALAAAAAAIAELNSMASAAAAPAASSAAVDDPMAAFAAAAAASPSAGPALRGASQQPIPPGANAAPISLPTFSVPATPLQAKAIELLSDVNLNVKIELGRTRMVLDDVLKLTDGSVVELDKLAGDPVDVYVNNRHVARGEVLVLNDNFCVRINEILSAVSEITGSGQAA
ncbi:MAG: flagellar motor switch protein FliN [Planctomycetota bacterium]|nr:flagellar motor switch protein FliN [Planctomycetota bacterium]